MSLLEVQDLTLNFGGVTALDRVNVAIDTGQIFSIIGPNGAGKTSLLNCISRLYHPSHGRIVFDGQEITHLAAHRIAALGIARTFQNIELFRGMTVLENLMLGRHIRMRSGVFAGALYLGKAQREEIAHREVVEDIVDFLEIQHIRRQVVGALPYGLMKRVEMGRALALQPKLLLLDEPMTGMNVEEKEDMARFILDANEERDITIILIEHDMGVVMDISDGVAVLDFGKKIAEGAPDEVKTNPEVIRAYLGEESEFIRQKELELESARASARRND
jgi:branched-chain amino acid transport system ATP-binding protein